MDCKKVTEVMKGVYIIKKCFCTNCANRRNDTKAFYERFDKLYQQYSQK